MPPDLKPFVYFFFAHPLHINFFKLTFCEGFFLKMDQGWAGIHRINKLSALKPSLGSFFSNKYNYIVHIEKSYKCVLKRNMCYFTRKSPHSSTFDIFIHIFFAMLLCFFENTNYVTKYTVRAQISHVGNLVVWIKP